MHWVSGFAGLQLFLGTGFLAYPLAHVYGIHTPKGEAPSEVVVFWVDFCLKNGIDLNFTHCILDQDCFVRGLCFSDVYKLSGAFSCVIRLYMVMAIKTKHLCSLQSEQIGNYVAFISSCSQCIKCLVIAG
jgi:hypothetical protein